MNQCPRLFRAAQAVFLGVVAGCVLALACAGFAPKTACALEVGEQFDYKGLTYQVTTPSTSGVPGKATLVGAVDGGDANDFNTYTVNKSALAIIDEMQDGIPTTRGEWYEIAAVAPDALSSLAGKPLRLSAQAVALYDRVLAVLPKTASVELLADTGKTITAHSSKAFDITSKDGAVQSVALSDAWSFSGYWIGPDDLTLKNDTADSLEARFRYVSKVESHVIPAGGEFSVGWTLPYLTNFTYQVGEGEPQAYVDIPSGSFEPLVVRLPASTPPNATVTVDLASDRGISQGLLTSSWKPANATSVTLSNGTAETEVDISSAFLSDMSSSYTIRFETAPIWIDGVPYSADYTSDDGSISLSLAGDIPQLTLKNAHLSITGGPDGSRKKSVISCEGDLVLKVIGDNSITVNDPANPSEAISVGGDLTVISEDFVNSGSLAIDYTHTAGSMDSVSGSSRFVNVVQARNFLLESAHLDIDYRLADGLAADRAYANMVHASKTASLSGRNTALSLAIQGGLAYGLASEGDIRIFDSEMRASGNARSTVYAVHGDVDISGRSKVDVVGGDTSRFGTIQSMHGTIAVDVAASGYVRAQALHAAGAESTALIAANINIANKNCALVAPSISNGGRIGAMFDDYYLPLDGSHRQGIWERRDEQDVPAVDVLIMPTGNFEGEVMGKLFPDESLGMWLWGENVLGKTAPYDPSHVVTAEESKLITACDWVEYTGTAESLAASGIDRLKALEFLNLDLVGDNNAVISLPNNPVLANLQVPSAKVESLTFQDMPKVRWMRLGSGHEATTARALSIGRGMDSVSDVNVSWYTQTTALDLSGAQDSLTRLTLLAFHGLTALDLADLHALDALKIEYCRALDTVAIADDVPLRTVEIADTALSALRLPDNGKLSRLVVADGRLEKLEVPSSCRGVLKNVTVNGNHLASLDLSGCILDTFDQEGAGYGEGQSASMAGAQQADGSVVVDLSALSEAIVSVSSGAGTYDEQTGMLTFPTVQAAKAGFAYVCDTQGIVASADGAAPALMTVSARVSPVQPWTPDVPPSPDVPVAPSTPGQSGQVDQATEAPRPIGDAMLAATGDSSATAAGCLLSLALASGVGLFLMRCRRYF